MYDDGILCITIDGCGKVKSHLRFLIFVGRYRSDEIRVMSGISSTISKGFTPLAQKVIFVKTDKPFEGQESKKYGLKSNLIRSLCETFSSFNNLLCDASFRPIKTIQSIN